MRFVFAFLLLLLVACSQSQELNGEVEFIEEDLTLMLSQKMHDKNISHVVNGKVINYDFKDEQSVNALMWEVIKKRHPSNMYTNSDQKYLELFEEMLLEEGVEYSEKHLQGTKYFFWAESDNDKVQRMRDRILQQQSMDDVEQAIKAHQSSAKK